MGVRVQDRDWRIATHLFRTRMLTTRQIADLCFEGRFCAAQARLYVLRKADFVKNVVCPGVEGALWFLGRKTFEILRGDDSLSKYPGPLAPPFIGHLLATNSLYVALLPLLDNLPWRYRDEWSWLGEPGCHRRFRAGHTDASLHVLKPDAEVSLPEISFLIERQTAQARERPEKLHDKVFAYHRFINALDAEAGSGYTLLWACDELRDARTVLQARQHHPTKTPRELGMNDFQERRMPVDAGSVQAVAGYIHATATQLAHEAT